MTLIQSEDDQRKREQRQSLKVAASNIAELRSLLKIIVPQQDTLSPRSLTFVELMIAHLKQDSDGIMITPMQLRWLRSLAAVIERQAREGAES